MEQILPINYEYAIPNRVNQDLQELLRFIYALGTNFMI